MSMRSQAGSTSRPSSNLYPITQGTLPTRSSSTINQTQRPPSGSSSQSPNRYPLTVRRSPSPTPNVSRSSPSLPTHRPLEPVVNLDITDQSNPSMSISMAAPELIHQNMPTPPPPIYPNQVQEQLPRPVKDQSLMQPRYHQQQMGSPPQDHRPVNSQPVQARYQPQPMRSQNQDHYQPQQQPLRASNQQPYQQQQEPIKLQEQPPMQELHQQQPVNSENQSQGQQQFELEQLREDTRVFGSPWLSERLRGIPEDKWKAMCPPTRNVATDTFEYSMEQEKSMADLKNHIGDLECELKIKQRELETNAFIEKELRRKLQNAEDAFQTKRQADEIEKQLDNQVRINQDLTMENAKLMDQLAEMNRKLLAHQAEIDNLDRVIASKNALKEEELRAKLQAEIENLRNDLDEKGRLLAKAYKEVTMAHAEVERKQKEIDLKDQRAKDLLSDLAHVRERLSDAETRHAEAIAGRTSAERERSVLQTVLDHKEPFNQTLERLTQENTELKTYIETLESRIKILERDRQLAHELSQELREMHMAIQDKNVATLEKNKLSETLQNVELLLKDKTAEEETLRKELSLVQQYIKDIESENLQYRHHEGLLANSKDRFREAELKRVELVNQLAASQRKVRRLSTACVDRNRYLAAISSELAVFDPHPHGAKLHRLATDANRLIREELPLADPNDPIVEEVLPHDLSDIYQSEVRLGNRHTSGGGSPGYAYRSQSASPSLKRDGTLDSIGSGHRYNDWIMELAQKGEEAKGRRSRRSSHGSKYAGMYLSGVSDVEDSPSLAKRGQLTGASSVYGGHSPAPVVDELDYEPISQPRVGIQGLTPDPPFNVRAKPITDDVYLVHWDLPVMDAEEKNNGLRLNGYQISFNEKDVQMVSSPWMTKALVNLSSHSDAKKRDFGNKGPRLAVQAVTTDGQKSSIAPAKLDSIQFDH